MILSLTIIILVLAGNDYYSCSSRVEYLGTRTNNFIVILIDAGGTVVINPEQNNTLICPGESFHYLCHVSRNSSITWSVLCPGQRQGSSRTLSVTSTQTEHNRSVNCNYNSNAFNLDFHLTYTTTQRGAHSNITIDVTSWNYSVIEAQIVRIVCEDRIYRYVEVLGTDIHDGYYIMKIL